MWTDGGRAFSGETRVSDEWPKDSPLFWRTGSILLTLTAVNAEVADGATLTVPLVRTKMDADVTVSDPATAQALRSALDALAHAINTQ